MATHARRCPATSASALHASRAPRTGSAGRRRAGSCARCSPRTRARNPRLLRFEAGRHGKPRLTGEDRLRFNLSHSGGVALYAFALDREVGVDVELPRRTVDQVAIARRILGDGEAERLQALDPAAREREFLRAWVRWEAVLKCRGTGIGSAGAPSGGPDPWVEQLDVGAPVAAALAVEGGPCAVRCWQWPPASAGARLQSPD